MCDGGIEKRGFYKSLALIAIPSLNRPEMYLNIFELGPAQEKL